MWHCRTGIGSGVCCNREHHAVSLYDAIYLGLWSLEWDQDHYKIFMEEYVHGSAALWRALRLAGVNIDHWNTGAWNL